MKDPEIVKKGRKGGDVTKSNWGYSRTPNPRSFDRGAEFALPAKRGVFAPQQGNRANPEKPVGPDVPCESNYGIPGIGPGKQKNIPLKKV